MHTHTPTGKDFQLAGRCRNTFLIDSEGFAQALVTIFVGLEEHFWNAIKFSMLFKIKVLFPEDGSL